MEEYDNKADIVGNNRLFSIFQDVGLNNKESVVLVGGTNDGQSSQILLQWCPNVTFFGFEIQKEHFATASQKLAVKEKYPSAVVLNLGWSDTDQTDVPIGGSGETGGLFDPEGQRGWTMQSDTVNTVSLDSWTNVNSIDTVLYVLIDTEGHEPKVIRGMRLGQDGNARKFSMFQYEMGGTWAAEDHRHGNDPWSAYDMAVHLIENGFQLFLIGSINWLLLDAQFFNETGPAGEKNPVMHDEGFGPFVLASNILAMHPQYAPAAVVQRIMEHVKVVY